MVVCGSVGCMVDVADTVDGCVFFFPKKFIILGGEFLNCFANNKQGEWFQFLLSLSLTAVLLLFLCSPPSSQRILRESSSKQKTTATYRARIFSTALAGSQRQFVWQSVVFSITFLVWSLAFESKTNKR
jgi:hypothetical protein